MERKSHYVYIILSFLQLKKICTIIKFKRFHIFPGGSILLSDMQEFNRRSLVFSNFSQIFVLKKQNKI